MSRTTMPRVRGAALPCVALLISCACADSPLATERYDGVFALATIDGAPVPADAPNDTDAGVGLVTTVLADTLVFLPGGLGHWTNVWRRRSVASGEVVDSSYRRTPFRYVRSGDVMRVWILSCSVECRESFSDDVRVESDDAFERFRFDQRRWRYTRVAEPPTPILRIGHGTTGRQPHTEPSA